MPGSAWSLVIVRLLAAVGIAVGAGIVFGHPQLWVILVLAGYLAWNLYHVYRLDRWLRFREGTRPRQAIGVWGQIYAEFHRIRQLNRDRKKRLNRLLKEFRKSTSALPDASVVLNAQNEITWRNDVAQRLLGISKKDRGQKIDALLRDADFIDYLRRQQFDRPLSLSSPVDGRVKLAIRIVPYGTGQQLLLAKDVTRERRLEKIRKDFIGNASHELRSPLTVVSGYLDSLETDPEIPESWKAPIHEMVVQSARMRSLIEDLLTLSRLEASSSATSNEPVDVRGLACLVRKDALAAGPRKGEIELKLESEAGIRGAESELYSAFWNLVQNAVKYSAPEGVIEIRWRDDDDGGHFSVRDTGVGIPEKALPRLTERFYRVHKGRDRARGGTGLGLAIVKHVLQRHDASLEVTSELGKGSEFTCHFPRSRLAE
ncbi:MAG: phosphate regulon sensor histidine kinase PhoR [Gammaproteobacteria bacterium]|nr:MAG: phosphate regulon sensor histidine kinase PhoR [Gammaproteobacteria bacterium]